MGIRLERKKPRSLLVSFIYQLSRLPLLSAAGKFRLFLDLEWVFERLCHEYSFKHYEPIDHPLRSWAADSLQFAGHSVLDLGCGTGELSFLIAQAARHVTGVDHDAHVIARARTRYQRENLEFVESDALAFLETCGRSFDTLVLSHVLEHLDDPRALLLRLHERFTRVYIEVPDFDRSYLNRCRLDLDLDLVYSDSDHIWEYDRRELAELLQRCGLETIRAEYVLGLQKVWCQTAGAGARNGETTIDVPLAAGSGDASSLRGKSLEGVAETDGTEQRVEG
jgi:SAM-dependent methyltransferase